MTIRRATPKDAHAISALIQRVTNSNPNEYSQEQITAWNNYNSPTEVAEQFKNRMLFCAFDHETLIGTIALKEQTVLGFYVDASHQGKGVGATLLNHLETVAREKQIDVLQLTSTPSALAFYRNRGFKVIRNVVIPIDGVDYPETEMEKCLNSID